MAAQETKGLQVTLEQNGVKVFHEGRSSRGLSITFQRTVRVSDNDKENNLPPGLGPFPLYEAKKFVDKLPSHLVEKVLSCLCIVKREAMWIDFKSLDPFAIRIYLGGVNAITGTPAFESANTTIKRLQNIKQRKSIQDYVVTPSQLWLDGIANEDGTVRQFVAMPINTGYSVEAQITGADTIRGLQIEVVPQKVSALKLADTNRLAAVRKQYFPSSDYPQSHIVVQTLTGKKLHFPISPDQTIRSLIFLIHDAEGIPPDQQRIVHSGKQLEWDRTFSDYGIAGGHTVTLILRIRGGGAPIKVRDEMGIAAGGTIKQTIKKDIYSPNDWDPESSTEFNVSILDSQNFSQITGKEAPYTPIDAKTYASYGFPYFEIYDEQPSGIHGAFDVKSVNTLDMSHLNTSHHTFFKHIAEVNESTNNPTIQLDGEGRRRAFQPVSRLYESTKLSCQELLAKYEKLLAEAEGKLTEKFQKLDFDEDGKDTDFSDTGSSDVEVAVRVEQLKEKCEVLRKTLSDDPLPGSGRNHSPLPLR